MTTDGVDVRPLRQMTGDAEFNEVFLTDVQIPRSAQLGKVGEGWLVARTTLSSERETLGSAVDARGSGPIRLALELWSSTEDHPPARRDELTRLWIRAEAVRLLNVEAGGSDSPDQAQRSGSVSKLARAETTQRIFDFCVRQKGAAGMLYGSYEMRRHSSPFLFGDDPQWMYLRTRANTIAGGSSEVLRDIVAERVLGLPREARADQGRPWADVPRN
jgi:alkylation response protein AidB-like acyl-CoA dehydrogenase